MRNIVIRDGSKEGVVWRTGDESWNGLAGVSMRLRLGHCVGWIVRGFRPDRHAVFSPRTALSHHIRVRGGGAFLTRRWRSSSPNRGTKARLLSLRSVWFRQAGFPFPKRTPRPDKAFLGSRSCCLSADKSLRAITGIWLERNTAP